MRICLLTTSRVECRRCGLTLLEVLVALAILGAYVEFVSLSMQSVDTRRENVTDEAISLRARAIESSDIVSASITVDGRAYTITALPDGSILAPRLLSIDRLTGRPK